MNRSPKRFEDTRAGNVALAMMLLAAAVICALRFGGVYLFGHTW